MHYFNEHRPDGDINPFWNDLKEWILFNGGNMTLMDIVKPIAFIKIKTERRPKFAWDPSIMEELMKPEWSQII
jgi:hypothetical protein